VGPGRWDQKNIFSEKMVYLKKRFTFVFNKIVQQENQAWKP
jgi:hypothetical protein